VGCTGLPVLKCVALRAAKATFAFRPVTSQVR
jgi:hypothetical protein